MTFSQSTRSKRNQKLFGWWVLANTFGLTIVLVGWSRGQGVFLLFMPLLIIAQWLVLRPYIQKAVNWIWSSILGLVVGVILALYPFLLALFASDSYTIEPMSAVFLTVAGAILGAALGIAQWGLCLAKVHNTGMWVLYSAIGWSLATVTWVIKTNTGLPTTLSLLSPVLGGLPGMVLGIITGLGLSQWFPSAEDSTPSIRL